MSDKNLYAVVLAGGSASRFGSTKQVALIGDRPMVAYAVANAETLCGPRTLLVTGDAWGAVVNAAGLQQGFYVVNSRFTTGLSSSIAAGIRSVRGQADAVLLLLADQPLVTRAHLEKLMAAWQQSPRSIVASAYANTLGPPVIFPARFFDELMATSGDKGARSVLDAHRNAVIELIFEDAAIDVDTPADLAKIQPDTASG